MKGSGATILTAAFALVLAALAVGYLVVRTYTPPASASPVTPQVRQFSLHMHELDGKEKARHWVPAVLFANAGDTVILRVTNNDPDMAHGFGLAGANISAPSLAPGETKTFRFRADRPGVYQFGCVLAGCAPDHEEQTGQLVVQGSR